MSGHPPSPPLLSVVIPTYGGQNTIFTLLTRLRTVMEERGQAYEVIIVNDSSPDRTWELLEQRAAEFPEVRAIDLLRNHGQLIATMCGMAHARGDWVATMDDDLQQPPEEFPKLLDALEKNPRWDAVVGSWPRDEGLWRNFGSWVHATLDRLAQGTPKDFRYTSFRVMRRAVVDAMLANETRTPIVGPLLRQTSDRVYNVEVVHKEREGGNSGFRLRHGIAYVLTNFLQGSTLPLKLLARFGLLVTGLSAILAAIFLTRWAMGATIPPGWTSSFLATLFFGGATLFGLGILGEYVHLIVREVRRPPRWRVRQELDAGRTETTRPVAAEATEHPVAAERRQGGGT